MLVVEPLGMPPAKKSAQRPAAARFRTDRVRAPEDRERLNYIYEWRRAIDISQAEMAERIDVSVGTMSNYENGKSNIGFDALQEIAEVISVVIPCTIVDLLTRPPGGDDANALLHRMTKSDRERSFRMLKDFANIDGRETKKPN